MLLVLLQSHLMPAADLQAQTQQGHQALHLAARPPQEVLSGLALTVAVRRDLSDHQTFVVVRCLAEVMTEATDVCIGTVEKEDC